MTQNDDRHDVKPAPSTAAGEKQEPTNVELQFMGHTDVREELDAEVKAESRETDDYRERGMDKQDVASDLSMDASDPPSTNMGDADEEMTP
ncbi:M-like protein [Deinococcus humi]|uniref:M-like protein n=1 Tax=Deinococcus humi TaxID=662880 RepID=A0A7W8JW57_9DEIO|nr:M-like protein [Deinococcus humi]MBB5362754.1 hypothetical protein [Deinococcus humi]GGO30798.1 hypothetical protein GCM10008949_25930 [Deinococcus humi]